MTSGAVLIIVIGLLIAIGFTYQPALDLVRTRRVLAAGIVSLILLGLLYRFRGLLPPFVVPLILAYLLDPLLDKMEKMGYSRVRAILLVYTSLLLFFTLVGLLVMPPLVEQVGELVEPMTQEGGIDVGTIEAMLSNQDKLQKGVAKVLLKAGLRPEWIIRVEEHLESLNLEERLATATEWLVLQLQRLATWLAQQVSGLFWVLLLPITLFYFLRDFDPLRRRLYYLLPPANRPEMLALATDINRALGGYLRGYAVLSVVVGIVQTTVLLALTPIFDFRYGLFLGLLAGATYVVPYVGSFTSVVLSTLVIYFTGGTSLVEAGIAFVILQGINSLFDNVISPRVIGGSVGIHPLWVMFALLAGGAEFGLLGVILATPMTVCFKIALEHAFPRLSEPIPADETPEAQCGDELDPAEEPEIVPTENPEPFAAAPELPATEDQDR